MATILVRDVDLFFRAKLEAQLAGAHEFVTSGDADIAVVDISKVDVLERARELADTPTIAFTNHTDTEGLRAAHEAGFDRIVIRSLISAQAEKLISELLDPAAAS